MPQSDLSDGLELWTRCRVGMRILETPVILLGRAVASWYDVLKGSGGSTTSRRPTGSSRESFCVLQSS